jgi:mono/diheme cytochrome c family protein
MKISDIALAGLLVTAMLPGAVAAAGPRNKNSSTTAVASSSQPQDDIMRIEGERRFHANCARCHAAPHKFPPRMMGTIVRHMRVRATITDKDMRLILYYMTQ